MKYHHALFFTLFTLFSENIDSVSTLRCADKCWFGPVEPGSQYPFTVPCNTIDVDPRSFECIVTIAIKVSDNELIGLADARPRATSMPATLITIVDFNRHSTGSLINYTCSTNDDCDQQFVLQSIGSSKWSQLNVTKTREKITALLIDESSTVKNFTCAHNATCETFYNNCQADYIQESLSPRSNTTKFDNNYKCIINHLTEIAVSHYFTAPNQNHTTVTEVMCNRDHCNEREAVERALNIIENEFTLPLNYSQFMPAT